MQVGTFVKTLSPHVVEILGLTGLDFAAIDAEHAPFDRAALDLMMLASRAAQLPIHVRIPTRGRRSCRCSTSARRDWWCRTSTRRRAARSCRAGGTAAASAASQLAAVGGLWRSARAALEAGTRA
jgi:hypothetical protein